MAVDFTKLTDAVAKVTDLAKSHGDAVAMAAQHKAELAQVQVDLDTIAAQLIAAVSTTAEEHGIAAVAAALAPEQPVSTATTLPAVSLDAMVAAMKTH